MIDYRTYTLPNGLIVIHNYDPGAVMIAVNVVYRTGSRDENRRLTGIAHLFEHLMFGGSAHVPDFDGVLEQAGGVSNAWTSSDFTSFYDVLPAANVETALYLESDRMDALSFNSETLATQKRVVIEEFKQQCLNRPYGRLMHVLREALYAPEHPYSWPVIGIEPSHIRQVTEADVRIWFYTHYAPDNAVLAISGNLGYERGRELVERWFGAVPRRNVAQRRLPQPGFPAESRTVTIDDPAVTDPLLVIAMPMAAYDSPDYRVADCITDLLSAGQSTRFYRNLVAGGDGTIVEADASIIGSEHEGFVMLTAWPADASEATFEHAERLLMEQIEQLSMPGNVSEHELERTFNRFHVTFALSHYSLMTRAAGLATAALHGEDINDTVARQRAITCTDIARVASSLAGGPRVTLRWRPAAAQEDTCPTAS